MHAVSHRRAPTRRATPLTAIGLVVCLTACGPGGESPAPTADPVAAAPSAGTGPDWFVDRAPEVGLAFTHFNGMSGAFYQPEIMGPGVGLCDVDNDGDLDAYLVQGATLGDTPPTVGLPATQPPGDRLFRNDLGPDADGQPSLRFTDITEAAGITADGYGMGVACGDIDNDGWVDIYVTRFGRNQLFRNLGDGTFEDVPDRGGADDTSWGVPAAFLDYDRDGWLDLFVGNYLNYTLESHTPCFFRAGPPDYCPPEVSPAEPSLLYRNRGDGTFEEVTAAAGLGRDFGPALGAASADYNDDGWIDLFVANDQQENQLWINQGDGTFRNEALLWGVALGAAGDAKADMGVDAGDFDNDGDEDLFVTELTGQGSTLYVNDGAGLFEDQSARRGIRGPSLPHTGFGAGWLDVDNDGWLDVVAVNGFVAQRLDAVGGDDPFPLQARNQLFRNVDGDAFEDVTDQAGAVFDLLEVSRGLALGDVDNDGDTDILMGNAAGPARLLVNTVGQDRHWLGLRLLGADGPRDMVGARVTIVPSGGPTRWRRARADGSYASANDPRVLVGLGETDAVETVTVRWPDGSEESWADLDIDRYHTLTQGSGAPVAR